jgi:hypothetical protein
VRLVGYLKEIRNILATEKLVQFLVKAVPLNVRKAHRDSGGITPLIPILDTR